MELNKDYEKFDEIFEGYISIKSILERAEKSDKTKQTIIYTLLDDLMKLTNKLIGNDTKYKDIVTIQYTCDAISNWSEINLSEEECKKFLESFSDDLLETILFEHMLVTGINHKIIIDDLEKQTKHALKFKDEVKNSRLSLHTDYLYKKSKEDYEKNQNK